METQQFNAKNSRDKGRDGEIRKLLIRCIIKSRNMKLYVVSLIKEKWWNRNEKYFLFCRVFVSGNFQKNRENVFPDFRKLVHWRIISCIVYVGWSYDSLKLKTINFDDLFLIDGALVLCIYCKLWLNRITCKIYNCSFLRNFLMSLAGGWLGCSPTFFPVRVFNWASKHLTFPLV